MTSAHRVVQEIRGSLRVIAHTHQDQLRQLVIPHEGLKVNL